MAFEVTYDQERAVGGSPAANSIKEFRRRGPNSVYFSGEINDVAGWFYRHTPCLQHEIKGFATVKGKPPSESYLCKIEVGYKVKEEGKKNSPASNGVRWAVEDHTGQVLSKGIVRPADFPPTGHYATVDKVDKWWMEIPDNKRTLITRAVIAGGLQIPPFHFVTFLRDPRRVRVKITIEYWYTVTQVGAYTTNADGSKSYIAFTDPVTVLEKSGKFTVSEEPDWFPKTDASHTGKEPIERKVQNPQQPPKKEKKDKKNEKKGERGD